MPIWSILLYVAVVTVTAVVGMWMRREKEVPEEPAIAQKENSIGHSGSVTGSRIIFVVRDLAFCYILIIIELRRISHETQYY